MFPSYAVWSVLLSDHHVETITSRLLKDGFSVRALGSTPCQTPPGAAFAVLNLLLVQENNRTPVVDSSEALVCYFENLYKELGVRYFTTIVGRPHDCSWVTGNIALKGSPSYSTVAPITPSAQGN